MNVLDRRYLLTVGPWRAIGYLASTVPVGVAAAVPFGLLGLPLLLAYSRLQPIWILPGLALLVGLGPLVAMPLADVERARLRLLGTGPSAPGTGRSGPNAGSARATPRPPPGVRSPTPCCS